MAGETISKRSNLLIHNVDQLRPPHGPQDVPVQGADVADATLAPDDVDVDVDVLQAGPTATQKKAHFWSKKDKNALPLTQGTAPAQRGFGSFCCGLCLGSSLTNTNTNNRAWFPRQQPTQILANVPPPPATLSTPPQSKPAAKDPVVYEA